MAWEYLVLSVKAGMLDSDASLEVGPFGATVGRDKLNSALNTLGGQGWEAFSTMFDAKGIATQVVLKKPK